MTNHSLKQTFTNLDIQGCGTNVKMHRRAGRMVYGGEEGVVAYYETETLAQRNNRWPQSYQPQ